MSSNVDIKSPLFLINSLRETDQYLTSIYTQGGCYRFHLFLKKLWPDATPVKNKDFDHVGSVIDGVCYDINGEADWPFYPMNSKELSQAEKWTFSGESMLLLGFCPNCDEPLVV